MSMRDKAYQRLQRALRVIRLNRFLNHMEIKVMRCYYRLPYLLKGTLSFPVCNVCFHTEQEAKNISLCCCRRESRLEDGENALHLDLALQSDLGPVSHSGLGTVWPGALWHFLLSCMGPNEN